MSTATERRNYSVAGPESKRAQEKGLAAAEWYASPIPRARLKELMKRKNGPAIRDTIIWFAALIGTGALAYYSWGTWWAVPAFIIYGVVFSLSADSRWHECGHGTAFKTPWMNEAVYQIASFMSFRPATPWRWSHTRHHSDTIIVGRDPEIIAPRPPVWRVIVGDMFRFYHAPKEFNKILQNCFGFMDKEVKEYVPASEYRKVFWEARIYVLIILAVVAWAVHERSIVPLMFIGLPLVFGSFVPATFSMSQHLGLKEDVLDHRLNTRTIYMNPISRFLYWNMNYHIEHHMFPMVPYHALPALHKEVKSDCPTPSPSLWSAMKDVLSALAKQRKDPAYTIVRPLPNTARPYKYGLDYRMRIESRAHRSEIT